MGLAVLVDELEVQQGHALPAFHALLDGAHQERALAHLARALDRQRLARLADVRQRRRVGRARQVPRIVDVERAARDGQGRGVRRRQVGCGARRRADRRGRTWRMAAEHGLQLLEQPRRVGRVRPRRVLNLVQVRVQRVWQRPVEGDAHRQDARGAIDGRVMPGDLDLAAHHFAAARLRGQEDDQVVRLADLLLDLLRPGLPDRQPLVDEDVMPRARKRIDHVARQRAVGFDVPLVAEKDPRASSGGAGQVECHDAATLRRRARSRSPASPRA